jgi:hypothetical protein
LTKKTEGRKSRDTVPLRELKCRSVLIPYQYLVGNRFELVSTFPKLRKSNRTVIMQQFRNNLSCFFLLNKYAFNEFYDTTNKIAMNNIFTTYMLALFSQVPLPFHVDSLKDTVGSLDTVC